ncbi:DcaP family trimeric outer membrane transporter [Vibrio astriarenae]|uniref:DcaP family trimeric outer membrane transporter n=1 Tax=Vibrio astriarenae TaxID=1481923 RepID=UPI0037350990
MSVFIALPSYASTEINLSGKVTVAAIADSDAEGLGANNLSSVLYAKSGDGEIKLDTTLTRLNFGTKTDLGNGETIDSFVAFDFNNTNNSEMAVRFREGYVKWQSGNKTILAGQTWSTLMDMNAYPSMVLEPTITGVVFTRQPMVRFSQDLGAVKYDIAVEQSKESTYKGDETGATNTPDLILGLETNRDHFWFRATSVVNQIKVKSDDKKYDELGYGLHLSGGIKFNGKDFWNVSYFNSNGNDRYVLGSNSTSSALLGDTLEASESQGIWTSIGHSWTPRLKSTVGYGLWKSDSLRLNDTLDQITESEFALANIKYALRDNLSVGAEYNYTAANKTGYIERDNHRLILAVDYVF